jgi:hypothetical protein
MVDREQSLKYNTHTLKHKEQTMQHWEELDRYDRDGFGIIVDKTWEDSSISRCFDAEDLPEIREKINNGTLDWFMLRVRVVVEGLEVAEKFLGGCLYESAEDILTDGTAEDLIAEALTEAKSKVYHLHQRFAALSAQVDSE